MDPKRPTSIRENGLRLLRLLDGCYVALGVVFLLSAAVNLLYLTSSIYMMEIYDRIIPSRSIATLVSLTVIVFVMFAFQGLFDVLRSRVLARVGGVVDERLSRQVFALVQRTPRQGMDDGLSPIRDVDQVRSFFVGGGPSSFLDLPWIPFYLVLCFAFHPLVGLVSLLGSLCLFGLTLLTDLVSREPAAKTGKAASLRMGLAASARRNVEVVQAMGMEAALANRWTKTSSLYTSLQMGVTDAAVNFSGLSRVIRLSLQSGVMGIGAVLVMAGETSSGIIIASSILAARALAPVESLIAHWKSFLAFRTSWARLCSAFDELGVSADVLDLPLPRKAIEVQGVQARPPGSPNIVVRDVSFTLNAGQGLGIIGPSGSGKSSLARVLVGVWPTFRGKVCLDGAALDQWSRNRLGPGIGYIPQDVELFAGTVAENIARFEPNPSTEAVLKAAQSAGVHDLILTLPKGYMTAIGEGGEALSGGQRQRLALARALYKDPFLLVLDEPNSNLDSEGEAALTQALLTVRERGGIVIVVAHRASALAAVDQVLALAEGRAVALGPKDEILRQVLRAENQPAQRGGGPSTPANLHAPQPAMSGSRS
ncbi:MAG: type I secretion system permease/ATPase [Alsobacter sp.]